MRSVSRVRRRAVLGTVLTVVSAFVLAPAVSASATPAPVRPAQAPCADREQPPPPVDTSERPAPGELSPDPLPVADEPAGGERMAECGYVLPDSVPAAKAVPKPDTAASWLLQNLDTGEVLAAKDPHARQRPASLIKTLLALVAIEELEPNQVIVPTKEDASQECTCVGITAGGKYSVDILLRALLMHSGNDVAHAFATALGGERTAVTKMNDLADRLSAKDTRAATPSGLDGPGMSTSAYDMSLIFRYAMTKPEYADAVGTRELRFPGGPGKPGFPVYNDNKLLDSYPGFLGGKTGFTDDARHTYAGAAERSGTRLAVVLLRAENKPIPASDQATRLLDYGFTLAAKHGSVGTVELPPAQQLTRDTASAPAGAGQAAGAANDDTSDPFGVTGWLVTMLVIALTAVGIPMAHRKGLLQRPD